MNNKKIVITSVITAWTILVVIGKYVTRQKQLETNLEKAEISKWDGEGGSLPTSGFIKT